MICGFSFVKVDCDLHVGNLLEVTLFQQREKSAGDEVDTCYIDVECRVEVRPVSKGRQSRSASWEREFPSSNSQQVGNEPGATYGYIVSIPPGLLFNAPALLIRTSRPLPPRDSST